MRIDKFLKVARLIKRRSLAQTACRSGLVFINGKVAKPGSPVHVSDRIILVAAEWETEVVVTGLPKGDKEVLFELIERRRRKEE